MRVATFTLWSYGLSDSVTPHDCALAIALPLTERRFLTELHASDHDYAAFVRSLHTVDGVDDQYYWDCVYAPFADLMKEACIAVASRGVNVVFDATLADVSALLARFPIVTFVSHWHFRALQVAEITDFEAFAGRLCAPPDELTRMFAQAIFAREREALDHGPRHLVNAINDVLRSAHSHYVADRHEPLLLMKIPGRRLTRAALEKAFPDVIAPARAVEFADGMKTIVEMTDGIPVGFCGLFDLTVCNSAIVGDAIKAARPNCTVAVNRYSTEPHIRLALYGRVIDDLARRPAPYADALSRFGKP
jgi:hypothetical protein